MKSIFTSFSLVALCSIVSLNSFGQGCSDLIISEVLEGWSNNKAIEIYNPTAAAIDASEYGLVRFQNGDTAPGNITYLEGVTIEPYDVYVVVLDKRDPDGVSFEAPVWDELQLQADIFVNPLYNDGQEVMYFNGNDAVALMKDDGSVLVDVFGKIGDSINTEGWGSYIDGAGEQAFVSADHTLIRKFDITLGYASNPATFDILNEYDSLPANTFTELGFHMCACAPISVNEVESKSELKLFPNPVESNFVTLASSELISSIQIVGLTGKLIESMDLNSVYSAYLDLSNVPSGTYFIKARMVSGLDVNEILIKK